MTDLSRSDLYPVLPLRDIVVFPHLIVPLFVGREKSVRALEEVVKNDRQILLVTQRDATQDDPEAADLYDVGTVGSIIQLLKLPDGTVKVLVEGLHRARITGYQEKSAFFEAWAEASDLEEDGEDIDALTRSVVVQFEQYIKLNRKIPPEVLTSINQIDEPDKLADTVASHLSLKISEKQELLECATTAQRLERLYGFMEGEIGVLQVEKRVRSRVKRQMEKTQRDYYLNEQMKAIQKELGEGEDGKDELSEIEDKIKNLKMTTESRDKALAELKKLRSMSPMSAEATVVRNYLDWLTSIPWKKRSKIRKNIPNASAVLDREHYGLEKVKDRILEYLAVQQRMRKVKGPILCLVGPPGVGKTSLGQSIARATGRHFVRMSLGGIRDESEVRGHRRTYIGSMPGKIVQGMKKAGTSNPLFLLDEIDKLGHDYRGDPSSALLEVLDPTQNVAFNDHYLEVDYDLSDVMFVTTANSLNMPQPLLDRMEIIRISGYTEDEKMQIALRHLIPNLLKDHGVRDGEWEITDSALRKLIQLYTREAGVRSLERAIAKLLRKAVKQIEMGETTSVTVTPDNLGQYAGVARYRYGEAEEKDLVGVSTGLAWTEAGGELLSIEAVTVPGKGRVSSTGKLGDVMKESIQAAEYFVKSRALEFGIKPDLFDKKDIHVHVPEGATPKDGPSAGIAMVSAIVSALTGHAIRSDVAMTGEVTLRGRVLAIGGLKEKLLAALRGNIKTVIIPQENEKDLVEIPDHVLEGLKIVPCTSVDEVLSVTLCEPLVSIKDWTGAETSDVVTH